MHLGASERFLLLKSRIALAEARLYEKRGEFPLAGDRAGAAARQAQQVAGRAAQVASRYEVTLEALRGWNGQTAEGALEPGARLEIEARRVPPPRQQVRYVVQPGDSWWSIATAHAIDSKDLRATNGSVPARLTVGDALVLWIVAWRAD